MTGTVASISTGVMESVLAKLNNLIGDTCTSLIGMSSDIQFLRDELPAMNVLLEKLEETDQLDPEVKIWMNQVRQMSYDIEDSIDGYMNNVGSAAAKAGFMNEVSNFIKTLKTRIQTAWQIKDLRIRLQEISERRKRYKLDDRISSTTFVTIDPRLSAFYNETSDLVGIDGPKKKLMEWVMDEVQQLKVTSIVGFGGSGKTTLANEVYREAGGQINCKAFVSVSQKPDIIRLLSIVLSKFGLHPPSSHASEVKDLIEIIRDYLSNKRYLIVVDDLWDAPTWDIIRCSFPENGNRSRVIVTTRVRHVATRASSLHQHKFIYEMQYLNSHDSRRLFFNRVFGSEDGCPSQFEQVSDEILKRCSGLSLAIITIASLLSNKPERLIKEWESIQNSIGAQFGLNATLEGMRQILDLSYKDLPSPLKTCLLYLGMYPEDYVIRRDDLIRQWVAEGFVSNLHGQDLEDVAKSYFNELVNRSLIQPARTYCGEVMSCKVHDMMLDLILSKCEEYNYLSVAYSSQDMGNLRDCKVRRLSLDFRVGSGPNVMISGTTNASLSQVRSVALFGGRVLVPPPLQFRYLRVLILEYGFGTMEDGSSVDLTVVGHLFQLRYLKISIYDKQSAKALKLPDEIGGLQYLETLEIESNGIRVSIPSDIVRLPRLAHLIVSQGLELLDGIGNLKSLRTLQSFYMKDMKDIKAIGELTSLRNLGLRSSWTLEATEIDALVTSLGKLRDLRCLYCYSIHDEENLLGSLYCPPSIKKLFLLGWHLPGVPKCISSDLRNLTHLELYVLTTSTDEVRVLGELPSLLHLHLAVERGPSTGTIIFGTAGFPYLEHLDLYCRTGDAMSYLGFEAAVMPKLQWLRLSFKDSEWGGTTTPVGMEHLLSLQRIVLSVDYGKIEGSRDTVGHIVEAKRTRALSFFTNYAEQVHPSRPSIHVQSSVKM